MTMLQQTPPRATQTPAQPTPEVVPYRPVPPGESRRRATAGSRPSLLHQVIAYALLAVGSIAFLVPFFFVVNGSLKSEVEVQAGDFVTPPKTLHDVRWSNYPLALSKQKMD